MKPLYSHSTPVLPGNKGSPIAVEFPFSELQREPSHQWLWVLTITSSQELYPEGLSFEGGVDIKCFLGFVVVVLERVYFLLNLH